MSEGTSSLTQREDWQFMLPPIAITGVACRFAGAEDPAAFWRMMCDGRSSIKEAPEDRWRAVPTSNVDDPALPRTEPHRGGFLDRIDQFEPMFFGISPREAVQIDPQQRLMLELSWEAMEDAGLPVESLRGSKTGVFYGAMWNDYSKLFTPRLITQHTITGQDLSIIAGRVSYTFGFRGPSIVVSTASSSSLIAVHLACQSLWLQESTIALAGGVNLIVAPDGTAALHKLGTLSPGNCARPFDASADGYVRGEGGGVILLKPLARAIDDGDSIYCVIRGAAVNNDGGGSGLAAPNSHAQQELLREAYSRAGIDPGRVHYVEAHGTGTRLGDEAEARALGAVFGAGRPEERPLVVGSVKPNVGHLEAAAGVAGLIKVALSIKHKAIPPTLNFELPSQDIPFRDLRLKIQTSLDSWPCAGEPVTAGVSSFGIGGTNCHFVLEEAPGRREPSSLSPLSETKLAQAELLLLSAHSPTALRSLAAKVALMLEEQQEISLRDLCYTASARRSHHQHRIALVCRAREEVIENLHAFARGESPPAVSAGCHTADRHQKIVFLFSGLGSRWAGMGRELMKREPVFMASLIECDRAIREYLDWSLIEGLTSDKDHPRANAASASQCVLFAIQVSVAALLRSWGIEPDGVMGYGWGDIAASHVAGGLSLDDAARILSHLPPRSRLRSIAPSVPVYSTDSVARGNDTKSEIKRRPTAAVSTLTTKLLDEGYSIFLEISPHPILLPAIDRAAGDAGREVAALGSLRREVERAALLEAAGKLYTLGRSVNWAKLYAGNASFVRLPTYPWQRERYWIDPDQPHQMLEAPAPQERASTSEERGTVLQDFVRQQVAKVLMLAPADVDLHQHFIKLGMDSLMALELQSSIESVLGVSVPVVELLEELTIGELANQLHEQLHGGAGPGCARDDIVDRESWELLRI